MLLPLKLKTGRGLVCIEIRRTPPDGFGLTDHSLITQTGAATNLTMTWEAGKTV